MNNDVIEHNKKRALEAKIYEFQEDLVDKGYNAGDVEMQVAAYRERLQNQSSNVRLKTHSNFTTYYYLLLPTITYYFPTIY